MKTSEFFILLFFFSLLALILGLFKANLVLFFTKNKSRKRVLLYYLPLSIIFFFTAGAYGLEEKEMESLNNTKNKITTCYQHKHNTYKYIFLHIHI